MSKTFRLQNEFMKEPDSIPASQDSSKVHVDLYLKALKIPLWERGGMKAYAIAKGLEFSTEDNFKNLFQTY